MIDLAEMSPIVGTEGWDRRFLQLAAHLSTWSKDPSTKIGCVIVGPDREIRSTGFNGFPRGVLDRKDRLENREVKYKLICHAEENAIAQAARVGVSLKGCSSYCPWPSCSRCARSLINAGISEVIFSDKEVPERWREDFLLGLDMFKEAGVDARTVPLKVPDVAVEVAHCKYCNGLTFDPKDEMCGCGQELEPLSKRIRPGETLQVEELVSG